MRTNIILDDQLVDQALRLSGYKTKKEVVNQALLEFVQKRNQRDLRELQGKIEFSEAYDYKAMRGEN